MSVTGGRRVGRLALGAVLLLAACSPETRSADPRPARPNAAQPLLLDPGKRYGNRYADGRLPVGDGKHTVDGPRPGYLFTCPQYERSLTGFAGGAEVRGPWFSEDGQWYYPSKKVHVQGHVHHHGSFAETHSEQARVITTNDLPRDHPTGQFPVAQDDTAYQYDRNPNTIRPQRLTYVLPPKPTYGKPQCVANEVGVMLSGVILFNALDSSGRDAGAWEVQDSCSGHPEIVGEYHYHTLSPCIPNPGVGEVLGYALDGFPITGGQLGPDNVLTTGDLDECHGITSAIVLDGEEVTMYHYVMTEDFPYSVGCFRGRPTTVQGHPQPGPPPPPAPPR